MCNGKEDVEFWDKEENQEEKVQSAQVAEGMREVM